MEGGKKMKVNKMIKILFVAMLFVIFISLSIISFSDKDLATSINNSINNKLDYQIIYKTEFCLASESLIYKENNKEYYVECHDPKDIYINWSNGKIEKLQDSLNDKSVTIKSLQDHGLNIKIVEEYENEY